MNKKRLLKMADFVETIPRANFDMGELWNECGSVGCAMGHAAHAKIFRDLRLTEDGTVYKGKRTSFVATVQDLFEIDNCAAWELFNLRPRHKTPKQVARNIRRFVESNGAELP